MITLEGTLCERQKELNFKVKEAAQNKADFREVKSAIEYSDVDRLFKIDVAATYKNTDHFVEELRCGNSLYISRVLKWDWIYADKYSHIINPDFLHHNVFPAMSIKMKIKTLISIANNVRDETRAQLFYVYCMNTNMKRNAYKLLIFTSNSFKAEILNTFGDYLNHTEFQNYKDLIGNSFHLAEIYCKRRGSLVDLSYLYSANDVEYLDLFDKLERSKDIYVYSKRSFGGKMSRSILKKHKSRVLKNPLPYLSVIKKSELVKYSTSDDAKIYAAALLPKDAEEFWRMNYYKTHKRILDLVKTGSMYEFIKQIFSKKYPCEKFEMSQQFYNTKGYELMTVEERETWALMHLEKQTDLIPEDKNYQLYEFVKFSLAFEKIKNKIMITTSADQRLEMLNVLTKSIKTLEELESLLSYYYKRHVNERSSQKESFLTNVAHTHKIFEWNDACWSMFDKLLHSLDVYNSGSWKWREILGDALIYHIINKITLPNGLRNHLDSKLSFREIKSSSDHLCAEKKDLVYNYFLEFLTNKLKGFESLEYTEEVKMQVRRWLDLIIDLQNVFKKKDQYPEIALRFFNLDTYFNTIVNENAERQALDKITEGSLIRCLKENPSAIPEKFSLIEKKFGSSSDFRLNMFLKKLKIYFSNDLAKQYVDLCMTSLFNIPSEDKKYYGYTIVYANVFAIFQLGEEHTKIEFMDKYAPTSKKIEHGVIEEHVRLIQEAICRFHCYSRPPVPLAKTALYLKGDYVHYSNDMLNMYVVELTPTLRTEFIKFLLNSPVSIQARGLRLAFLVFEIRELKEVITKVWGNTKNVSVRSNLFKSIVAKIKTADEKSKLELFEILKELIFHLHEDDDKEVFDHFNGRKIPDSLRGFFLETCWKFVSALPQKTETSVGRRLSVVKAMHENIHLMDEAYMEGIVLEHVHRRLTEAKLRKINPDSENLRSLDEALWDLVAAYIVTIPTELKQEKSLNILKVIVKECFDHWNETHDTEEFIYQLFFKQFANRLDTNADYFNSYHKNIYPKVIHVFKYLLDSFEEKFGIRDTYSYLWDWKLSIITRTVIENRDKLLREHFTSFGIELGVFVDELKQRNCYYNSFLDKILGKISRFINILRFYRTEELNENDIKVLVAYGLSRHEILETLVLAISMMPRAQELSTSSATNVEFDEVISTIKKQNNDELAALLKDKYTNDDCKVRKIMM